jgi:hypothetical protein
MVGALLGFVWQRGFSVDTVWSFDHPCVLTRKVFHFQSFLSAN